MVMHGTRFANRDDPFQIEKTMSGLPCVTPEAADAGSPAAGRHTAGNTGIAVSAAGRLHLGFLDPSATVGRRFGSIGMMIEDAETVVHLASSVVQRLGADIHAQHEVDRAGRIVAQLQRASGRYDPIRLHVSKALPAHVGLGSGTQLALAIGRGFSELHGLGLSTGAIATLLGRGLRSGIGLAGFEHGGVLVDGGHRSRHERGPRGGAIEAPRSDDIPPLLARFDFPDQWRVILVQDLTRCGLHGDGERLGLQRLPTFSRVKAAHLCHLVLMLILPALAERDFAPFARGISELQEEVGSYFAPVQGGVFSSPGVGRLISWISDHHLAAAGQSSWGPTAFAIVPSEEKAQIIVSAARAAGVIDAGLVIKIVAGRNRGASVESRAEPVPAMG